MKRILVVMKPGMAVGPTLEGDRIEVYRGEQFVGRAQAEDIECFQPDEAVLELPGDAAAKQGPGDGDTGGGSA